MSKIASVIVTVLVIGGGLVYLLSSSFGDSMVYYKTVDELLAEKGRFEGRTVRINGVLEERSIRQNPSTGEYRFTIAKGGKKIDVAYEGVLPDAMQPGREIVIHGRLAPQNETFQASEILTKCPSKYEAEAKSRD